MIMAFLGLWRVWLIVGLLAATFTAGIRVESHHRDAAELVMERNYEKAYHDRVVFSNDLAKKLGERKDEIRTVYQTITKEVTRVVDRPVYRNVCIDDDGLRLINDALAGRRPAAVGGNEAVPAADTAHGKDGQGRDAKAGGGK